MVAWFDLAQVRRQAIATLGELLFYVSTRDLSDLSSDEGSETNQISMEIPACAALAVAKALRAGEDDVVRHYAAKTIENVAAQSPVYGHVSFLRFSCLISIIATWKNGLQVQKSSWPWYKCSSPALRNLYE